MAITIDSSETTEADGEGQDGSDKPPHDGVHTKQVNGTNGSTISASAVGSRGLSKSEQPPGPPGLLATNADYYNAVHGSKLSVPLPPPETGARPKEPGHTKKSLSSLIGSQQPAYVAPDMMSAIASSSGSDSDGWSASGPSTRPPSQAPSRASSRAPSMSYGKSGSKVLPDTVEKPTAEKLNTPLPPSSPTPKPDRTSTTTIKPKETPSLQSYGEGQKFTLKELLANGPKLHRKSSVRSTASSKKSDSDGAKSTAGESTGSLLKKYGVCGRVAIGKGATSVVRLAHKWDRTEEKLYAVKEFRKRRKNETEKEYVKKLTAEFCISSTLHHANIVETVDLVQDENQHWCEVMEFCPGGDLYAAIKKGGMSTNEVECCFKQILNGVAYLHSQGVAHRDIKPENLFFDAHGQLKIGDYGASTVYRLPWETTVHMSTGLCGSEPYIAPEQFTMKPYDARLVDIWACGVVFYCLHFQELPWRVAQMSDPLYAAYATACASTPSSQSSFPPTINNLTPRACRPLIRRMLDPDPKTRWSIEEIIAHPWVHNIEVCHLVAKPTHVHVHALSLAQSPPA